MQSLFAGSVGLEEVTHLAAYTTAVFQSSRGDHENGAHPLPIIASIFVLGEASTHYLITDALNLLMSIAACVLLSFHGALRYIKPAEEVARCRASHLMLSRRHRSFKSQDCALWDKLQKGTDLLSSVDKRGINLACRFKGTTVRLSPRHNIPHDLTLNPLVGRLQPFTERSARLPAELLPDQPVVRVAASDALRPGDVFFADLAYRRYQPLSPQAG